MNDQVSARPRIGATVLGYPRIGLNRELKRAVEDYWAGRCDATALAAAARALRANTWRELAAAGLDSVPGNTFSYYDQVLDTAVLFDAVPDRFRRLGLSDLDTYFAMARGHDTVAPLEMTKWFDTNYHYLVPELGPGTRFQLAGDKPSAEYREALSVGVLTRPVLLGPLTFLLLAKPAPDAPAGFSPLELIESLVDCYVDLLGHLAAAGVAWVQLDEPAFVADRTLDELEALRRIYVILVYSEFGRRVRANASQGTDHGTAGPAFLLGEKVNGGFYGAQPSLTDLDNGDLRETTDFRDIYATLLDHVLSTDPAPILNNHPGRLPNAIHT